MKVSVFMITYNHEPFIGQAIESIVSQQTDFDFELVIGEDCSTDNTLRVCERYAAQYPDRIRLLPSDKNYGPIGNTIRTLSACEGEYMALCEGDDYWTDPLKLQKQVDFLEANPDFSMCFSAVDIQDDMDLNVPYERFFPKIEKDVLTIGDFILSEMSLIPTPTLFLRNVIPRPLPAFFADARGGDMGIQLLAADKGKTKYFSDKTAVYRNHAGGITKSKDHLEKQNEALMTFYDEFNKYFDYRYDTLFRKRFLMNAKVNLIFGSRDKKGLNKFIYFTRVFPKYLKYSEGINIKEILYYISILFFPFVLKLKAKKQ